MSWTSRSRVRAGSAVFTLLLLAALSALPARADDVPDVWMAGTRMAFDRAQLRGADIAVATGDPGLARFLGRVGATLSYQPGQRYVVVTAADRRTITFSIGDTRVDAGGIVTAAPFAPYTSGSDAYLPLDSLARALYVLPVPDGNALVLQPQVGGLDVRTDDRVTTVTLRAAVPLSSRRVSFSGGRFSVTLTGVGSALDQTRVVNAPGLDRIDVVASGSPRYPATTVSFAIPSGAQHVVVPSSSPDDLTFAFAPPGVAIRSSAIPPAMESSNSSVPSTATAAASVTGVDLSSAPSDVASVRVAVSGGVDYEWHRLNDNRFYVDLRGATLAMPPRDDMPNVAGVVGLRVRQFSLDPVPTVRVSLTLASQRRVDVSPTTDGLTIVVGAEDDTAPERVGLGRIGAGASSGAVSQNPTSSTEAWKFGPQHPVPAVPAPRNPRLIVLDPGHGGSDSGAAHNGLVEKDVTLDIARRLRSMLVSRGWLVRMTRDTDVDVFAPNDSARDELQARCDIANKAGARMFISIHGNSFTTSSLSGTTTYYYKDVDHPFADIVHRHLIAELGTKDDGVRKENFYVIHHTAMPAILVETAFLSNSGDADLLRSPAFLQHVATAIADGVTEYARAVPMQTSDAQ